jgi:hypothetical protein
MAINTPVTMIIFNRPEETLKVFSRVAAAKPRKLYVIADGPRQTSADDPERCAEVRKIFQSVDWECKLEKRYLDKNLGCGRGPAEGINWVLEKEQSTIILEDDCVPDISFFRYCDELLDLYREDERVMMIGGYSRLYDRRPQAHSYYFSGLPCCFGGWATWKRAWQKFDMNVRLWPELKKTDWLSDILLNTEEIVYWTSIFDQTYTDAGEGDYWDFQWTFTCWAHHGLTILPTINLIQNIGFGDNATHTRSTADRRIKIRADRMLFPMSHPLCMVRDRQADKLRHLYYAPSLGKRNRQFHRRLLSKLSPIKAWLGKYANARG